MNWEYLIRRSLASRGCAGFADEQNDWMHQATDLKKRLLGGRDCA